MEAAQLLPSFEKIRSGMTCSRSSRSEEPLRLASFRSSSFLLVRRLPLLLVLPERVTPLAGSAAAAEAKAVGMFPIRIAMPHLPRKARNAEEIGLKEGERKGESSCLIIFSILFFADINNNKYGGK